MPTNTQSLASRKVRNAPKPLATILAHDGSYRAAARRLGVSDSTVRRWVQQGSIPDARSSRVQHTAAGIKGYRKRAGLPTISAYSIRRSGERSVGYRLEDPDISRSAMQDTLRGLIHEAPFRVGSVIYVYPNVFGRVAQSNPYPIERGADYEESLFKVAGRMGAIIDDMADQQPGSATPVDDPDWLTVVLVEG